MADVLPWQAELWGQLAGRTQHAHAYLLHGPGGIGKRQLAEQLMALLLCQRPVNATACGECKACQLLAAHTHPDITSSSRKRSTRPYGSTRCVIWSASSPRLRSRVDRKSD